MLPWFSPVLAYLEKSMSEKLHQPVRIDFIIYRDYEVAKSALLTNGVDFARFGAASYVIAKGSNAAVSIVAAQKHENFRGAIFTQATNAAIQTIKDLRGKRLAFGNIISTTGSQLAKFYLAELGFHRSDFSNLATNYLRNHAHVTNLVAQGEFDAGAAKESYAKSPEFRILGTYPNIGMVWVGKPNLNSSDRQALTDCLLSVKPALVKKLEDAVIGFEAKSDSEYDDLRKKMKAAEEFEQR
jgi:ABC-type phosphate/phosphonate transport system substrate-binding protein